MATSMSSEDPQRRQVYRDCLGMPYSSLPSVRHVLPAAAHSLNTLMCRRVLDAYGHLSVRDPHYPDRFIMSRNVAPATIASERDLVDYYVETAEPLDANAPKGYAERYIHSEIFRRFQNVNAVVHSHSEAVLPYSISGVPFQPCFHMAGFIGTNTPVFDIGKHYEPGDQKDMLVRSSKFGTALASHFGENQTDHAVVLMRGHGFTVQGASIIEAVVRAVYTQRNASIQSAALLTRAAHYGPARSVSGDSAEPSMHYLSSDECEATTEIIRWSAARPWRLWLREIEAQAIYVNMI